MAVSTVGATLVLFVAMCTGAQDRNCERPDDFDPMTWTFTASVEEQDLDWAECSNLANAYATMRNVTEVDCYVQK